MRKEDWQNRLTNYITERKEKKFRWGSNDCVMFSIGALKAMTGIDFAKGYKKYRTKDEAYKLIKEQFRGDTDEVFKLILGAPINNVKKAKVGDVVRLTYDGLKTYGIMSDDGINLWLVSENNGIIKINKRFGEKVFCLL